MSPWEFEYLWLLDRYHLTAGELSCDVNHRRRDYARTTTRGVSNQLRSLERRGLVTHDAGRPRIHRLTPRGEEIVHA